jgi:hypothetical protein
MKIHWSYCTIHWSYELSLQRFWYDCYVDFLRNKCALHDQFQLELEGELLLRTLALIVCYPPSWTVAFKKQIQRSVPVRGSMPPSGEAQQHIRAPAGLASQLLVRHPTTNIRREQLS